MARIDVIGGKNPPQVGERDKAQKWRPNTGQDPAAYIIGPGTISGPNKHSSGNLRHARPYIVNGNKLFGFPVGVESFRRSGNASIGSHRTIGSRNVRGQTTQYEEGRVELSGVFPGITSQVKMEACLEILTTPQRNGMRLYMPGLFDTLIVLPENWDFSHEGDDRTHSIAYTISFLIIGVSKPVSDPKGKPAPTNPTIKKKPKGKPQRVFTVRANARTLISIARIVYNDADEWRLLVQRNQGQLNKWKKQHPKVTTHQIPTYRWPIGTKFSY